MALNPEEVVNKRFSATKFRQGYDEEEVDEFLDEVVAELRRLNGENEELRGKLSACESRVAELTRAGGARTEQVSAKAPESTPAPAPAPTPAPAAAPTPAPAPVAASASTGGVDSAAGMLALAQRLHDEHIEAGKAKGAKLVSDAEEQAARLVRDAEEKQRQTLGNLESQRQVLERKVESLRSFEREYRSRLKAYLENQLRDLESTSATSGSDAARPAEASAPLPSRAGGAGAPQGSGPQDGEGQTPRFPFGS